jgi:phospholipid-binding lipoprotein MlaA
VIGPVARGYGYVPYPIRDRIRDFARNLAAPLVFIHDLAQGNGDRALITFERFLVNTSMGGLGLVDIATQTGLTYHGEDMGQTLGSYGVASGPYLVLPILGPSNTRDAIGRVVDWFVDPVPYAVKDTDLQDVPFATKVAGAIDTRQRFDKQIRDLRANSIDFYAATRDLYEQARNRAIANGDESLTGTLDIPDYDAAPSN